MSMWLDGTGRHAERLWRRGRIALPCPMARKTRRQDGGDEAADR